MGSILGLCPAESARQVLAATAINFLDITISNTVDRVRDVEFCRRDYECAEISKKFRYVLIGIPTRTVDLIDSLLPNKNRKLALESLEMTSTSAKIPIRFIQKIQKLDLKSFDFYSALSFESKEGFATFCSILTSFTSLKSLGEIAIFPGCVEIFLNTIAENDHLKIKY